MPRLQRLFDVAEAAMVSGESDSDAVEQVDRLFVRNPARATPVATQRRSGAV
ncbi:hypothetical protein Q0N48_08410 [Corynebacterium ureicelerivorans]|uniref:hypothetical protein n=1 Tax=Corynebacterium ureicelerivorans TaxID=401472 RepID=UPI00265472FA|nr:hypothetical protein [Corynebacterium ureicelerivorans]MDN8606014.1 hypothetical protein [Corynebacterium ureicelerivorans]